MLSEELQKKLENFDFSINNVNQILKFVNLSYDELRTQDVNDYQWFTEKMMDKLLALFYTLDRQKFEIYKTLSVHGNWVEASDEQLELTTKDYVPLSLSLDIIIEFLQADQFEKALGYRNKFKFSDERYSRINDLIVYHLLEKK